MSAMRYELQSGVSVVTGRNKLSGAENRRARALPLPMFFHDLLFFKVIVACLFCGHSLAGTPSLEMVTPSVGTRGTSFSVVAKGASLKAARTIVFYDPGLRCEKIVATNDEEIRIDIVVDSRCALGPHSFRLLSDDGFSELRTLTVSPFPTVVEDKELDSQVVPVNATILGTLEGDDVDVYQLQAKAGERISAEAVGVRLGVTLLDTVLTLRDPKGTLIERVDDTPWLNQDPAFSVVALETGLYSVEITSAGANADADSQYALHIGNFPRPHMVFPLGAKAGSEMEMTFASAAEDGKGSFTKPMKFDSGLIGTRFVEITDAGVVCPSPIPIRLNTYGQALLEARSQDEAAGTSVLEVPVAIHGVIRETAETDSFCFAVHQTGMVSLEVFASRLGSLLDSLVEVRDQAGLAVCGGDDFESHDSRLVFEAKAGETYTASIRDKRKNAGAAYVYLVEIAPLQSSLTAFLPRRSKLSQAGQTIAIPRGNRTLGFIGVHRDRMEGDVKLAFDGLPLGVASDCFTAAESQFLVPVVFAADAAAATAGTLVGVQCTLENSKSGVTTGGFEQVVDLVNGPADAIFQPAVVDRLSVAITNSVPFSIELVKPSVSLSSDGTLDVTIQVKREPGFDAPIDITFPLLPEWVDCEARTRIGADQDSGTITLRSNRLASGGTWPIVAEGTAGISDGSSAVPVAAAAAGMAGMRPRRSSGASLTSVCSSLHTLEIAESPIRGTIASVSVERGTQMELECKLEFGDSVPKTLTATIEGLPNRVHAKAVSIRPMDKVARFQLVIEEDAPTGTFDQIVCRLSGTIDNQQVSFCVARDTKLIIAAPGASQKDETGRPLSSLEALRRRRGVTGGS